MSKPSAARRIKKPAPPSDEVLLAEIAVRQVHAKTLRTFVLCVGAALIVLATWPVANTLAGKNTVLQVSIALSLTVAVTVAGGGAFAWGRHHKRRADRLETRNERLSRDVKELQARLRDNGLSPKVSR